MMGLMDFDFQFCLKKTLEKIKLLCPEKEKKV
jgi:hypothetical protein